MRSLLLLLLAVQLSACGFTARKESRIVDLPVHPEATLEAAKALCFELSKKDFDGELRRRVPGYQPGYGENIYVGWFEDRARPGSGIYLETGVTSADSVPAAKEIADGCREIVAEAVAARFGRSARRD